MTRKSKLTAVAAVLVGVGLVSCSSVASSDSGGPKGVQVQYYRSVETGRHCLVFTHDTMQGASIAVDCVDLPSGAFKDHE